MSRCSYRVLRSELRVGASPWSKVSLHPKAELIAGRVNERSNTSAQRGEPPCTGFYRSPGHLRRVERLLKRLLAKRSMEPDPYGKSRLDLLNLQREIQKDISRVKIAVKREEHPPGRGGQTINPAEENQ